jgi:hypothetical protein
LFGQALRKCFNEATGGGRECIQTTRPVSLPLFFQACWTLRDMKRAGAGPADGKLADLKGDLAASAQATSSLSRCRWKRLLVPAGRVSSNIMMLSPVWRPRSVNAREWPGVG